MALTTAQRPHLRRSTDDRMFLGVCGGLAEYFNVDPAWFRFAFVVATLAGGAGVLTYLVLAVVVPARDQPEGAAPIRRGADLGAAVLIGLGLLLLAGNLGLVDWMVWRHLWPVLLIGLGTAILLRRPQAN